MKINKRIKYALTLEYIIGFNGNPKKRKPISLKKQLQTFLKDGFCCSVCFDNKNLEVDHIIPISKGGEDEMYNYLTLCNSCNLKKNNKSIIEILKCSDMYDLILKEEKFKNVIFNEEISSNKGFFSATDLVKAGNKWRILNGKEPFLLKNYLQNKGVKEFTAELENEFGKVKINAKGRNQHTWVHPFLFIDIALSINPMLKIEVYKWLYDHLLKYRNNSGDSYKKMCGALYENATNKSEFHKFVRDTAKKIQVSCNVKDWNFANESQLKMRDKIHENISLLCDVLRDNEKAVFLGITKALKDK